MFVSICRTGNKEKAEQLAELLNGKTYMNFVSGAAPAGGEFEVFVEANESYTDLADMIIAVLAEEVMKTS